MPLWVIDSLANRMLRLAARAGVEDGAAIGYQLG